MDEIAHAYAIIAVHKSQGSEFPVVIMPIVGGPPLFLNRKLLWHRRHPGQKTADPDRQPVRSPADDQIQRTQTAKPPPYSIITGINHPML